MGSVSFNYLKKKCVMHEINYIDDVIEKNVHPPLVYVMRAGVYYHDGVYFRHYIVTLL
jgi:hypothetical protein